MRKENNDFLDRLNINLSSTLTSILISSLSFANENQKTNNNNLLDKLFTNQREENANFVNNLLNDFFTKQREENANLVNDFFTKQ